MRNQETRVLGVCALPPRLTWTALTLLACSVSVPVALLLWGIEIMT